MLAQTSVIRQGLEQRTSLAALGKDAFQPRFGGNTLGVKRTAMRSSANEPANVAPAETAPQPPAGWEKPPPLASISSGDKKTGTPACCGFDQTCCARQTDIDRGIRKPARKTFAVPFAKIPEPVVKEATKDGPPIEGIPDLHIVDGKGAPFPWKDGPEQFEIRLIPDGELGFIRFGKGNSSPHFRNPKYRSLSYGVTTSIAETQDQGRSLLKGPLEYWLYNRGQGDEIILDHVKGRLDGSPKVIAERWVHATAINIAEGIVHVYRATYEDKPYVFFLLPEVVIGFESKDTLTFGGTGNDRFATDFPYTLYRFPLGGGRSNTINCFIRQYEVQRWFERPKGGLKFPEEMPIILWMSQTSVESEPRIGGMFL